MNRQAAQSAAFAGIASGTMLVTSAGERPVETLREGDLVATRFAGLVPLRQCHQLPAGRGAATRRNRAPILILAGALGEGVPARDLRVAPGQFLLLEDVLVPASHLVNGVTIRQLLDMPDDGTSYVQLELAAHDCVMAAGAWVESLAAGSALCAPRRQEGQGLEALLRPLLARAGANLPPGPLEGWIDDISAHHVTGWAIGRDHPEFPVELEIWAGPRRLGQALACAYRADLRTAGKGSGRCAFLFTFPEALSLLEQAALEVRRAADGTPLQRAESCPKPGLSEG
jgi:Hint domain